MRSYSGLIVTDPASFWLMIDDLTATLATRVYFHEEIQILQVRDNRTKVSSLYIKTIPLAIRIANVKFM